MRYEDYKKSKYSSLYIQIARWCNQPQFFKKMSAWEHVDLMFTFDEYKNNYSLKFKCRIGAYFAKIYFTVLLSPIYIGADFFVK